MKIARAIISTLSLLIANLLMPVFLQWYKAKFNLSDESLMGPYMIIGVLEIGIIVLNILFWISAISGKDLKDIKI
jgi:hypothetical protein